MKQILCEKCKKVLKRNELYVPMTGRHKHKKLCKDCFECAIANIYNGKVRK